MTDNRPFIEVRQLYKSFYNGGEVVEVLRDLELSVHSGEVVTILGVSGTGKSTLLNILGGIDIPSSGLVRVSGVEVSGLSERALTAYRRDTVGFVFQFYNLIPSLTAQENVITALEAAGRLRAKEVERAHRLLEAVGLGEKANKFPEQLSGGEQQRVAIARALVKSPPLLLADEPTGNLDPHTGEKVLNLLVEQARATGATLLIITHNPAMSRDSDRSLRLSEGRLMPC